MPSASGQTPPTRKEQAGHEPGRAPVVLKATGLLKSYGGQRVLDGISVELRQGDVVLLRGDNGTGKTTLLNALTGNLELDAGRFSLMVNGASEEFSFPLDWMSRLNPLAHFRPERLVWAGVGRTWQEMRLFPSLTLRENLQLASSAQLGENPLWSLLRRRAVRKVEEGLCVAADRALAELGLSGRGESSADHVSLGQAKRVAIMRALEAGSKVLFLDEPLEGLDGDGVNEVLELLRRVARARELTLVIVEHAFNIPRILEIANRVWTLDSGRLAEETPEDLLRHNQRSSAHDVYSWIRSWIERGASVRREDLERDAVFTTVTPAGASAQEPMLRVTGLVVHQGRRQVLGRDSGEGDRGLHLELRRGQLGILQAPNGWGKTTLLDAVSGLLPATKGAIEIGGVMAGDRSTWQRARRGLRYTRALPRSFPNLRAREVLALAKTDADALGELSMQKVSSLSGGEKKRLVHACGIGGPDAELYLLDEPFEALDARGVQQLQSAIQGRLDSSAVLLAVPGRLESHGE